MTKSIAVVTTSLLMVCLTMGGNMAIAQQQAQNQKANTAKTGNAEALGVQEVGIQSWEPESQELPKPEEISVDLPNQVKLTPGPEKPNNPPDQEDHRGVQVKVLNPDP